MNILSIETSCDETSLALVECTGTAKRPAFKVLKHLIHSQIEMHREWGGVVPNIAKREHIVNLPRLFDQLFPEYKLSAKTYQLPFDAIAVTVGPGLEPALWTGITFAQELAQKLNKPLLGANHMEGHMFSILLNTEHGSKNKEVRSKVDSNVQFPAVGLVVSGGHTMLVKMDSYTKWTKLGETRDDAAGEAFDKVARMLELPYPGGPEISKLALTGDPAAIDFPRPMIRDKNYEFSFSGIKTAVLYYLRDNPKTAKSSKLKADVAASFQQAVVDVLVKKTMNAASEYAAQTVFVCGGVAANKSLRTQLSDVCDKRGIKFMSPANEYNTDNAAMIAAAAYLAKLRKKSYKMVADSTMTL